MLITLSIITLILYVILIFLFLNSDESNKIKARNIISATIGLLGINVAFFFGDNYISNDESSSIIESTYINTEMIETERNNIEYTVESNSSDILPSSEELNTDNYDESNVVIPTEYPDVFPTTQISKMEYISNMELFADGSDGYNKNKYLVDNYRNEYNSSISVDSGYISYLVKNMGYTHFCGTVALPKEVNPDSYRTSAQLEVYIDDILAFRSDVFTSESKPQQFDLDIVDAEVIKISWTCSGNNIWHNWCYYATVFDAYCSDDSYTPPEEGSNHLINSDKDVVNIANEDLFATNAERIYINDFLTTNYNEEYLTSFSVDGGYVSFLVKDRGFSTFSGIVALPKDVTPDSYKSSAQLEIYIDEVLAFRSDVFTSESKPQQFNLDITSAEVIKISWSCSGNNIWHNWCYYATIFDGKFKK